MENDKELMKLEKHLSIKKNIFINYFLDPIQYDGRIKRILKYFYMNNEPLFYLALSYCTIFTVIGYKILRKKVISSMFNRFSKRKSKEKFISSWLNIK